MLLKARRRIKPDQNTTEAQHIRITNDHQERIYLEDCKKILDYVESHEKKRKRKTRNHKSTPKDMMTPKVTTNSVPEKTLQTNDNLYTLYPVKVSSRKPRRVKKTNGIKQDDVSKRECNSKGKTRIQPKITNFLHLNIPATTPSSKTLTCQSLRLKTPKQKPSPKPPPPINLISNYLIIGNHSKSSPNCEPQISNYDSNSHLPEAPDPDERDTVDC